MHAKVLRELEMVDRLARELQQEKLAAQAEMARQLRAVRHALLVCGDWDGRRVQ